MTSLKLSHDFHMTLCALICTEFREQSVTAANIQKNFSKELTVHVTLDFVLYFFKLLHMACTWLEFV